MKNILANWSEEKRASFKNEPYMSSKMLAYFQEKLINWRDEIIMEIDDETIEIQNQIPGQAGDTADKGIAETGRWGELSKMNHNQMLLDEIDEAMIRIQEGRYGFCLETGKPIGFERLNSWPIAKLCLDAEGNQ